MRRGLEDSGLACEAAADAESAESALNDAPQEFDIILLDVMLPGRSGWEFLERLRNGAHDTPVIFITARHGVAERVRGLHLGADDYILKPFAFEELLARIGAVLRRRKRTEVAVHDLVIDLERGTVEREGRRVDLSPREFAMLRVLLEAEGRTLSRKELLRAVWGYEFDPGTNLVDVLVARVRRRIDPSRKGIIETRRGQGYRMALAERILP